jgi:hypothetical protein
MDDTHMLTGHKDIQNWVANRKGIPAVARIRNRFGEMHCKLAIRFAKPGPAPEKASIDDGLSPVAWSAWLAELDRQGLALRVSQQKQFEFVERGDGGGVH